MLLFSDLQLHNTHPVAGSDYLEFGLSAMRQIRQFSIQTQDDIVIHLGDTFQLKDRIPVKVWNAFFEELLEWENAGITSYWLKGNHDFKEDVTIQSLSILSSAIPIVHKTEMMLNGKRCLFLPYGHHLEEIDKSSEYGVLFMHDFFKNVSKKYGNVTAEEGIDVYSLSNFKYVFAGHSHSFQVINPNIWHIGSSYPVSFNEIHDKKFFAQLLYDKVEFHEFKFHPFIQIELEDNLDVFCRGTTELEGAYVKLRYNKNTTKFSDIKNLRDILISKGVRRIKLDPIITAVKERRIDGNTELMSDLDYIKFYINESYKNKVTLLDTENLLRVGKSVIEGKEVIKEDGQGEEEKNGKEKETNIKIVYTADNSTGTEIGLIRQTGRFDSSIRQV